MIRKPIFNTIIFFFIYFSITMAKPSFNSGPDCSCSGCHSFHDGLVSATLLDSIHIQISVSGVSSEKAVAGELVDSAGVVVDVINSTHTNPFVLTAPISGTFRINAGFKSPSRQWDSTSVTIGRVHHTRPDSGWQSDVIITEIMFDVPRDMAGDANGDGLRGSHSDEFVELYNRSDTTIDLGGYQILDREKIPVFTFPEASLLQPHQFAVVFGAVGTAGFGDNIPAQTALFAVHQNSNDNLGFDNGMGKSNFSNSGDCVVLVNAAKKDTLTEVYWGSASPVTTKPIYLAFPNTISGAAISGAIRQSVTHFADSLRWDMHTVVSGNQNSLFSPGSDVIIASSVQHKKAMPVHFELLQNYPNPFNPNTEIKYQLSKSTLVDLSVYNNVGQKVRTLVHERQEPGMYSVPFRAENLSSGIYFYQLAADNVVQTKKMLLLQ